MNNSNSKDLGFEAKKKSNRFGSNTKNNLSAIQSNK